MPGFDLGWFDELRAVGRSQVMEARDRLGRKMAFPLPRLGEMESLGLVRRTLLHPTLDLIAEIRRIQDLRLPDAFVVHVDGQAIYTRDTGYEKRQLNIGFGAYPLYGCDMMRIGVGFPMQNSTNSAVIEYAMFRKRVMDNPQAFDTVYTNVLGGYGEFDDGAKVWMPLSQKIVDDQTGGEWRFFGKRLTVANDSTLLSAIPELARTVVNVFNQINSALF